MTPSDTTSGGAELRRSIGPVQLALYALGSMVGSGIYGLIGKAAGQAGSAVWLSFLVALFAALLTAMSYASLGSRYPRAGGAAYVVGRAFGIPVLSFTIGLVLVASGLTSVATQAKIFAGILREFLGLAVLPPEAVAAGFLLILSGIVFRGIRESMWVNVTCTLMEVSGLLLVIVSGVSYWGSVDYFATPVDRADAALAVVVLQASVLTFFAFIGFEDAINVAEECRDPQRTIPIGLITATLAAAVFYVVIAITAVSVVPAQELAVAPSPLTEVMKRSAPNVPPLLMSFIALFSVANTALVNYVTASRLIYGMSRQGLLPASLGRIHARRSTPHIAVAALLLILLPLVLLGSISDLAAATVLLLLVVFITVNTSLIVLQRRAGEPRGALELPAILPALGALICAVLLVTRLTSSDVQAPMFAGLMISGILLLYAIMKRSSLAAGV